MKTFAVQFCASLILAAGASFFSAACALGDEPKAASPGASTPAEGDPADPAADTKSSDSAPAHEKQDSAKQDSGHAGHSEHDPHDLSHGNAGPGLTDAADIRFDLSIYTAIVFFLLLAILWKFAWGPISQGLEQRERSIADKIEAARLSADKAAEQLRSYEAKLAAATEEAGKIVAQSRRDAESAKDRILAEAQELSQRERERAIEDINAAKNVALREIAQKSVNTAVSLAGRIIRKEVKPQDHAQLIREALEQFPSQN